MNLEPKLSESLPRLILPLPTARALRLAALDGALLASPSAAAVGPSAPRASTATATSTS